MEATDTAANTQSSAYRFTAINLSIKGIDVVLGMLWLMLINPKVDWVSKKWTYRSVAGGIEIIDLAEFESELGEVIASCVL